MKQTTRLTEAVKQYAAGKEEAFNILYEESYKYLHTCVMHIMKDEDASQDMLQNTYLEVVKNIKQLNNPEEFLSWAAMIANRKCFAAIKKEKEVLVDENDRDGEDSSNFFEDIADDEAVIPENIFDDRAKIEIIRGIIDDLSDIQRACIIGFYYNDMKQEEIAGELNIPVNTVKSHLNRAKAKIKESVSDTEKKQGIKLLALAPFMLLFFNNEAQACELVPVSEELAKAAKTGVAAVNAAGAGASATDAAVIGATVAKGMGIGKIIALLAGGVALVGAAIFGIVKINEVGQKKSEVVVESSLNVETVSKEETETSVNEASISEVTEVSQETSTEISSETEEPAEPAASTKPTWDFASKQEEIKQACIEKFSFNSEIWEEYYTLYEVGEDKVVIVELVQEVFDEYFACVFSRDWESFEVVYMGEDYNVAIIPERKQINTFVTDRTADGMWADASVISIDDGKFTTDCVVRCGFSDFISTSDRLNWEVKNNSTEYDSSMDGFELLNAVSGEVWIDGGSWFPSINYEDSRVKNCKDHSIGEGETLEEAFSSLMK